MKTIWKKQNKYIRLRVARVGFTYRADISVNKYYYNESTHRYYEINFDVFSPYDYSSEEETFGKAKEWLYKELKQLQKNVKIEDED